MLLSILNFRVKPSTGADAAARIGALDFWKWCRPKLCLVSHPFRRKKRKGWGTEVYSKSQKALTCCALALALSLAAQAQAPAQAQQPAQPATTNQAPAAAPTPATAQSSTSDAAQPGITEEELKQLLVGKPLYLRGGYLDNTLSFSEHGALIGHSPEGSYTLNGVQIDKVRLTKHKVELEGARYGLHFLGALPYEDPTKAVDRVRITPKKKVLKITIDREQVVTPKKKNTKEQAAPGSAAAAQPAERSADQAADPGSVTTTISPAHATRTLKNALEHIFAQGFDDRLMASMPDFWKLYYQAAAAKADYRPVDSAVMRQNTVDKKARMVSTFEPESNEYAQANAVAGMALYHTVIGADGKPGEIAVGRPIGFGLDENAVEAIRKATFEPAIKDGKPVAVLLDVVVQFRIYSKRTAVAGKPEIDKPAGPPLPGPYSVQHP
jgi:outer membrane biosynthesis protein TonB